MKTYTSDIKYYDVEKIFKLNPKMDIKIQYLGKNKIPILIIKDFYKNPELVRELVIQSPVPQITSSNYGGYPGKRICLSNFITSNNFWHKYSDILRKYFKLSFHLEGMEQAFIANIFDQDGPATYKRNNLKPHADNQVIASVIYLNYDDEPVSGTYVFRHKECDLEFFPYSDFHFDWYTRHIASVHKRRLSDVIKEYKEKFSKCHDKIFIDYNNPDILKINKHVMKSDKEWEVLGGVKSKFNTLVAYIGGVLHSPMIDYEELKTKPYKRINQVMFMEAV